MTALRRFCFLAATGLLAACSAAPGDATGMAPADRADRLVLQVERLRGLRPDPLGKENQVAYGTLMLRYLPDTDRLMAAIMVNDFDMWKKMGAEFAGNYRRAVAALSDPAIGGMFDTGGGAWLFEEATGKTFLYRSYPLDTPAATIDRDIDRMAEVVPAWVTRWTGAVADIAHGHAARPAHPVTLKNDPYAGRL